MQQVGRATVAEMVGGTQNEELESDMLVEQA